MSSLTSMTEHSIPPCPFPSREELRKAGTRQEAIDELYEVWLAAHAEAMQTAWMASSIKSESASSPSSIAGEDVYVDDLDDNMQFSDDGDVPF